MHYRNRPDEDRVVITGMGVIAPNGIGQDAFWRQSLDGVSGVRAIDQFDASSFEARIAGSVPDFDPRAFGLDDDQCARLDRYAQFALAAATEAMTQAELDRDRVDGHGLGVCIATAIAGTRYMEEAFLRMTNEGRDALNADLADDALLAGISFNVASAEVARRYGARAPVTTLATGCTAGLDALGQAYDSIRAGQAEVMIAGAAEAPLTPIALGAFDIIGALCSDSNDCPDAASRPYDGSRKGFVLGESCGVFVLESLAHARRRGATVLAEVAGFGSTCNAYHMTDLKPDGEDLHRAMTIALDDAGLDSNQIDHVNAHGSSTPQNDVNETNAVKRTLGDRAYQIPVCSSKSLIGHALAAANAVETVAAVLALQHQQVPPTINYRQPDPDCDLNYVPNQAVPAEIRHVLKDASGFSGIHSALILGRAEGGVS